jgi:lycopene cyclase domain-containing protein
VRLLYLGVLAVSLAGTALPLELLLHTGVFTRRRRLLLTLAPVVVVFTGWDLWAIARHQWRYDAAQTTGVELPGHLPLEELLFFVVIPTCAILAFEAVRAVRGWPAGDE